MKHISSCCRCHTQVYYDKHDTKHDLSHSRLYEDLGESAPGEVESLAVCSHHSRVCLACLV